MRPVNCFCRSDSVLLLLMRYSINTGLLTSVCALIALITVRLANPSLRVTLPHLRIVTIVHYSPGKLHLLGILICVQQTCVHRSLLPVTFIGAHLLPIVYVNALLATFNARAVTVRNMFEAGRGPSWGSLSNIEFKSRDEGLSGGRVRNLHHRGMGKAFMEWCDVAYDSDRTWVHRAVVSAPRECPRGRC